MISVKSFVIGTVGEAGGYGVAGCTGGTRP